MKAGRSGLSSSASRLGTWMRKNDSASSNWSFDRTSRYRNSTGYSPSVCGVFVSPVLCQRKFSSRRGSVAAITSLVSAARYRNGCWKILRAWSRAANCATASCTFWFFSCFSSSATIGRPLRKKTKSISWFVSPK